MRLLLGAFAYILPTFPLGYVWHLVAFKSYYDGLQVYRDDIVIPFGLVAIAVQGFAWAYLYQRTFSGESVLRGATRFFMLAAPIAWSFMAVATAAKHHMASVSGFVLIESAFVVVHFLVVSPLMALAFSVREAPQHAT